MRPARSDTTWLTECIEQPELKDKDIIFRGLCDGECTDGGNCRPSFSLDLADGHNKGAKVTAAATWAAERSFASAPTGISTMACSTSNAPVARARP